MIASSGNPFKLQKSPAFATYEQLHVFFNSKPHIVFQSSVRCWLYTVKSQVFNLFSTNLVNAFIYAS